ncbi:MAG: formylglycine-generating enzyme family protein [Pseudomonadota bacterium]
MKGEKSAGEHAEANQRKDHPQGVEGFHISSFDGCFLARERPVFGKHELYGDLQLLEGVCSHLELVGLALFSPAGRVTTTWNVTQWTEMTMIASRTPKSLLLTFSLTTLVGCDAINDWHALEMVQRNMDNMVLVEGGEFLMGTPGGWAMGADTVPAHEVVLDDFYIQKSEVTQGDFEVFVEASGHRIKARFYENKRTESPERFANELPAPVSWHDAKAFCLWLDTQSGKNVDLPTEAQWEYAARSGGRPLRHATNNGELEPGRNISSANGPDWSLDRNSRELPEPPGRYQPNLIGLYDMSGNVAEWVNDYYHADYYQNSARINPMGPATGKAVSVAPGLKEPERVMRGGFRCAVKRPNMGLGGLTLQQKLAMMA